MSAIAGVVRLDRATASRRAVKAGIDALRARARGLADIWVSGPVGLAGDAHASLPPQPLAGADPQLIVISDACLYNRQELCAALGVTSSQTDSSLILAAYEKWGEDCPTRLIGDFAFAIWDSARAALFCARDHAGVRPFFYAHSSRQFVFGSELKSILASLGEHAIDRDRIADFLVAISPGASSTWYRDIFRLPPGHALRVRGGEIDVRAYWRPSAPVSFREGEVVEAFGELLEQSIVCRTTDATGAMLSGGLDSSSIALIASRASAPPLKTYSMVFEGCPDERAQIDSILRAGRFEPTFVKADQTGPFDDFSQILREQDGPFLAPGLAGTRQIYAAAARSGAGVLLDGHGGDEVVSHGLGWLTELALAGKWGTLWRNVQAEADIYKGARARMFLTYWMHFGPARRAFQRAHDLGFRVEQRARRALGRPDQTPAWRRFIDPAFAQETGLEARWREQCRARSGFSTESEHHLAMLSAPIQSHALEVLDHASAHAGVEARYPLWDRRLIEFCLSLRVQDKINDGQDRYTFRRAMEGVLPKAIQWRRDKFDFTPALALSMCSRHAALLDDIILSKTSVITDCVDRPSLERAYLRMKAHPARANGRDVQAVWRSAALALWLEAIKDPSTAPNRPVDKGAAKHETACA